MWDDHCTFRKTGLMEDSKRMMLNSFASHVHFPVLSANVP